MSTGTRAFAAPTKSFARKSRNSTAKFQTRRGGRAMNRKSSIMERGWPIQIARSAEDSRMDLGECEIEILLTPGHTPSNLSVYVPSDGVLYSAIAW